MKSTTTISAPAVLLAAPNVYAGLINFPPLPKDLTTPYQQRLAAYGPSSVSVGWNTYAPQSSSCVQYGTSHDNLNLQACSTIGSTTYPSSRTYSNVVILSDLTPATTYYYKIVSTNSTVGHFLSPRQPGDKTPFNLDVVIDLGVYGADGFTTSKRDDIPTIQPELNHSTIGRLATTVDDYEIVLHPGDFAYADDWYEKPHNLLDGKDAYQAILEQFYDQLAPIAGRKLYMASPGNHEADCTEIPYTSGLCPEGQRNFTDFLHRFGQTMPNAYTSSSTNTTAQALATKARSLSNPPFWYSFEYGMAHITMIDTETDFPDAPDGQGGSAGLDGGPFGTSHQQLDFLAADLASVDRSVTPWVIVAGHRPWYTTGDSSSSCTSCQAAFEDLFYSYGVDVGVFGHVHNSQRFLPVYNGTADAKGMNDPRAPMYIIAGGTGNIEGLSSVGTVPSYNAFVYADDYSYNVTPSQFAQRTARSHIFLCESFIIKVAAPILPFISQLATDQLYRTVHLQPGETSQKGLQEILNNPNLRRIPRKIYIDTVDESLNYDDEEEQKWPQGWDNLVPQVKELPRLNAAVLCFDKGFTSDSTDPDYYHYTDFPQTPQFRFQAMHKFFSLLESLRHPIQDLGIRNLQADNPKDPKTLAKMAKVLSGLLSLRLSITSETNDAAPEHDLEYPEIRKFFKELPSTWLSPAAPSLQHLSLYSREYSGFYPHLDLSNLLFPRLKTLSLGNFCFFHDGQINWILKHGDTLEEIYLDDCAVLYDFCMMEENVDACALPRDTLVRREGDESLYGSFEKRWHHIFDLFAEKLPKLRHFRIGRSNWYSDIPFEQERDIKVGLYYNRYMCCYDGYGPSPYMEGEDPKYAANLENGWRPSPECDDEDRAALRKLLAKLGQSI